MNTGYPHLQCSCGQPVHHLATDTNGQQNTFWEYLVVNNTIYDDLQTSKSLDL